MSELTIEYFGHSCFKLICHHKSLVFDPYRDNSVPGLSLPPGITADAVYCSHEHDDHAGREMIEASGKDPFPVTFIKVPHDDANGTKRGMNDITKVTIDEVTVTHMGDIGRLPTAHEYEELKDTDILLIPVGGHFTIDAEQAEEIIETIKPSLTILMHYREGERGYGVTADLRDVAKVIAFDKHEENTISFPLDDIPEGIITLEPIQ